MNLLLSILEIINKWIYFGCGVIGGVIGYKQLIK